MNRLRVRSRRVDPLAQEVFKFFPNNPPLRGEIVVVDGVRCRVTRCRVRWEPEGERYRWTIRSLRVKETGP